MNINMLLQIQNIEKKFENHEVLRDISIILENGSTLSILGKSGCGKTTLLKIIAGLLAQDGGEILLNDKNIDHLPAEKRDIVYIYQEPLLFPHLSVFENIAFGLRLRKINPKEISINVEQLIDDLGLRGHEKKMPNQISGGQKQRVAFGRAIIINPKVLLLDEPFGNLDTETRTQMQQLFKTITGTYPVTSLFVTHDLKEALIMGDRFAFMREGMLKIYESKKSFVEDESTGIQNEIRFWKNTDDKNII